MKVSSKTTYHHSEIHYGEPMDKAELCYRQFKSYVLWAKGTPRDLPIFKELLKSARHCYDLYKTHKYDDIVLAYENYIEYNDMEVTEVKEIA